MRTRETRVNLQAARQAFRERMASLGAPALWSRFHGRIAAVLAGGGARGGYEAGALLAIQDAALPLDLITATSIGSINGASFAAHAEGKVGNAEPLVDAWFELTPTTVGVEWTRYSWMIFGLLATFSGITSLIYYLMQTNDVQIHLAHPALAWSSLILAGISVLLFHDQLPYVYYVVSRMLRRSRWRPAKRRLALSLFANLLVASFVAAIFESLDIPGEINYLLVRKPLLVVAVFAGLVILQRLRRRAHPGVGRVWGALLRLPFRTGIFSNFERTRFLKRYIPAEGLQASAIRLVLTSTNLNTGTLRYFTNVSPRVFEGESGVDEHFVQSELVLLYDLMPAIIASSALPIAYEPLLLDGQLYADGAIVGSQPIRPAIRLGADVLLVISMENPGREKGEVRTFVDVGLRALDILMQRNLHADTALLATANHQIEDAALSLGIRPEDLVIEFEGRRFRYVKAYAIHPDRPIPHSILDFGARATGDTVIQGYTDACAKLEEFARYASGAGFSPERRVIPLALIKTPVD